MISILKYGDQALLVNFKQEIEPRVSQEVLLLYKNLLDIQSPAISFLVPAYCSLTIGFNPELIKTEELIEFIEFIYAQEKKLINESGKEFKLPVCYDEEFGPDLRTLSESLGISIPDIIKTHTSHSYRVYLIGFLPGFPYLGKLTKSLHCSRKQNPRLKVPRGAVAIAGEQTGIYPTESPGGWQIIGRTPIPLFDPMAENPALLAPGDTVQFESISKTEFLHLNDQIKNQKFTWKDLYE